MRSFIEYMHNPTSACCQEKCLLQAAELSEYPYSQIHLMFLAIYSGKNKRSFRKGNSARLTPTPISTELSVVRNLLFRENIV